VNDDQLPVTGGTIHDVSLATLFLQTDVSARLSNMLAKTKLGAMTLRECVQKREEVEAWMYRQQNCGRRTVIEFLALVDASSPGRVVSPPKAPVPKLEIDHVELTDLLAADNLSARLGQVMRCADLGQTKLRDYVHSRDQIEAWMLCQPNCGRRSVMELRRLVGAHLQKQIRNQGMDGVEVGRELSELIAVAEDDPAVSEGPPDDRGLADLLMWHVARLPARTQKILTLRFGLGGAEPWTLAEIGELYHITRERVRQVEAKGLRTIRTACRKYPIDPAVEACTPALLSSVFGGRRHALAAVADLRLTGFDGYTTLALEISFGSRRAWFEQKATRFGRGWLDPSVAPEGVTSIADAIHLHANNLFPRATGELLDGCDQTLAMAAMELVLGWTVEGGYTFPRRPGPRLRRTVQLHALLSTAQKPLDVVTLLRRYHEAVPADTCTDRDLVIVMEVASHLFLEIYEGIWAAIGQAGPLSFSTPARVENDIGATEQDAEEGTVAAALERELADTGPTRLGVLMARAIDILPEGRSRNSIGPTLLLNPTRFVRVLPGVYALPGQVLDSEELVRAGSIEYLLNAAQARFYAIARMAGEPWGSFPLWNPTAEMRFSRWARANDERDIYRSLLEIVCIDDWPTDDSDKEVWHSAKGRDACFEFWSDPRLGRARVPVDRVLAAGLWLRQQGSIGWVTANRILGYRPDSFTAAGLLARLAAAGMALQPDGRYGWQKPHDAGPRLEEWIKRLADALHETGNLAWTTAIGVELESSFDAVQDDGCPSDAGAQDEPDEYESIMAEHRRMVQARRIEVRLEMLGQ
jgi:hypothetical protein